MTREERIKCLNSMISDLTIEVIANEVPTKERHFLQLELRMLELARKLESENAWQEERK